MTAVSLTTVSTWSKHTSIAQPISRVWPSGWWSWSVNLNSTMLARLYMFQPFDLHHGSRPHHLWESYQHNTPAFRENDCTIGETQWDQSPVENTWLWSLLTAEGFSFLPQPPLKYLSPQLIAPLINYTPATGLQLIIYMLLISISPIDFCHSFEMYVVEGAFSH